MNLDLYIEIDFVDIFKNFNRKKIMKKRKFFIKKKIPLKIFFNFQFYFISMI